jgi:predicted nuclease of predicted toxin-antitoxin system
VKFKLDENLGTSAVRAFEDAGHDTSSIHRQNLAGADDGHVFRICRHEQRILVTLDLDFANPLTFDPRSTAGIVVLRLSRSPAPSELTASITALLGALAARSIEGSLWIVRHGRIRVWQPRAEEGGEPE